MNSNQDAKQFKKPSAPPRRRTCAICGRSETWNWTRHWDTWHKGEPIRELAEGQQPLMDQSDAQSASSLGGRPKKRTAKSLGKEDAALCYRQIQSCLNMKIPPFDKPVVEFENGHQRREIDQSFELTYINEDDLSDNCVGERKPTIKELTRSNVSSDLDIISTLRLLEVKENPTKVQMAKVYQVSHMLAQKQVIELLTEEELPGFCNVILRIKPTTEASVRQLAGILLAMTKLGGIYFECFKVFVDQIDLQSRSQVLKLFQSLVACIYPNKLIGEWIVHNYKFMSRETLKMFSFIEANQVDAPYKLLMVTRVCELEDDLPLLNFISNQLFKSNQGNWIELSLTEMPQQEKLAFEDFIGLVLEITASSNYQTVKSNQAHILSQPVCKWLSTLNSLCQNKTENETAEIGIEEVLNGLRQKYGDVNQHQLRLMEQRQDLALTEVLRQVTNKPNSIQMGLGAFAVAKTQITKKSLWCIPAGLGKTRVIAVAALASLMWTDVHQVRIVVPTQSLLTRDSTEFQDYWQLSQMTDKVQYHSSLDFKLLKGEIAIIDEADLFALKDPQKFEYVVGSQRCICYTATVTDHQHNSIDKDIFQALGFHLYNYWPHSELKPPRIFVDKTLPPMEDDQLLQLISQKQSERPVVIYASDRFANYLKERQIHHLNIDSQVSFQTLRNLEALKSNGQFPLMVIKDEDLMRGTDIRAFYVGICLIIDRSFSNARNSSQGLARVGRFGDRCERLLTHGTEIICREAANMELARLIAFKNLKRNQLLKQGQAKLSQNVTNKALMEGQQQIKNGRGQRLVTSFLNKTGQ